MLGRARMIKLFEGIKGKKWVVIAAAAAVGIQTDAAAYRGQAAVPVVKLPFDRWSAVQLRCIPA